MGDPLRAKETFQRVVTEYAAAKDARRRRCTRVHREALRTQPAPRPLTTGAPAPMAEAPAPRTRRLGPRRAGREPLHGRRVPEARGLPDRSPARQHRLRRRLRHAGRHLSPAGAARRGRGDVPQALRINPAYTEAALNLAVTSTISASTARRKAIYARRCGLEARPAQLDPFAKGKIANMHADMGAAYHAVGMYADAVREYQRALALCPTFVDIRTRLGTTLREMGDRRGRPRVRAGAGREPALRPGAAAPGPVLLRRRATRGRRPSGGPCSRSRPRTGPPRCTSRCWTRRRRGLTPRAAFVPHPRRSSSRRYRPTPPAGEGTHLFLWIEKRGLTTLDAIAASRAAGRRGARHRLRRPEGSPRRDAAVDQRRRRRPPRGPERRSSPTPVDISRHRHGNKLRLGPPARQPLRARRER